MVDMVKQSAHQWDRSGVLTALESVSATQSTAVARRLLTFADMHDAKVAWNKGVQATARVYFPQVSRTSCVFSLYVYETHGALAINYEYILPKVTSAAFTALLATLREHPLLATGMTKLEAAGFKRRPGVMLDELEADPTAVDQIEKALTMLL